MNRVLGFWGLNVSSGTVYKQTVDQPFRLDLAALHHGHAAHLQVNVDGTTLTLCRLTREKSEASIGITFEEGDEVSFLVKGDDKEAVKGAVEVSLVGNYVEDVDVLTKQDFYESLAEMGEGEEDGSDEGSDSDDDMDEEELEIDEEIMKQLQAKKAKKQNGTTKLLNAALLENAEESDEDDEDFQEGDSASDDDSEDSSEVDVVKQQPKTGEKRKMDQTKQEKQKQKEQQQPVKKLKDEKTTSNGVSKEAPSQKTKQEQTKKKDTNVPVTKVLDVNLKVTDVKPGEGPAAAKGKRCGMRYVGRLYNPKTGQPGKTFDKNTGGKPFYFKLGQGEVIKGWDVGVAGMKVNGERTIIVPPEMGYGKRGAPPDIPSNAWLQFDVQLVALK